MSVLCSNVLAAKERLARGLGELKRRHQAACPGSELCALATEWRDEIVLEFFGAARQDSREGETGDLQEDIALVAHGGYGRRDVAPYSDLDLMFLYAPAVRRRATRLAERLFRDLFDIGLMVGHSVRSPEEAVQLACGDPSIATSLMESRLLSGGEALFSQFLRSLRRFLRRRPQKLMAEIRRARHQERTRYGETVYLLEPNVKRSPGGLRDMHLLRWIAFVRYGTPELTRLQAMNVLSEKDVLAVGRAREFLLHLRNEMHFHAGRAADVLERDQQVRIAEKRGYPGSAGMLPVEQFMRDYFRHTDCVSQIAAQFVARAREKPRMANLAIAAFGHRAEPNLRVGPQTVAATNRGLEQLRGNLEAIIQTVEMAGLCDKPIATDTWEEIRRQTPRPAKQPSFEACRRFRSLLSNPARLGELLRGLHGTGVLENFIPVAAHARGLLQFNKYHKYTVDEHCLRAVEFATGLLFDMGPLGQAYRQIREKQVLHLALLIHDMGKGFPEDHREVGHRIARQTARRLWMPEKEGEMLAFLVHRHSLMNYLAFRRDVGDQRLVLQFAQEVGSPELLQMLFVMTAADLAAVGPGVWDTWKAEIVTDLYYRTSERLAGENPANLLRENTQSRREELQRMFACHDKRQWFLRQIGALPDSCLNTAAPEQIAEHLCLLERVDSEKVLVRADFQSETGMLELTIATGENIVPGIFHRLTGAIMSLGLEIHGAQINTLADGSVLDRFSVRDPDFAQQPPPERIEQITEKLCNSLQSNKDAAPTFRKTWRGGTRSLPGQRIAKTRVCFDNSTSEYHTIIDVFAHDRTGLLHTIARTLFELELSVFRAKVATHLDQVVDVFYVTDRREKKIENHVQLEAIRRRLLAAIDGSGNSGT